MKSFIWGVMAVSNVAFAGNFGGNGTGGVRVSSARVLIYDFWEAENRQFLYGGTLGSNLQISRDYGSTERANEKLARVAPYLAREAKRCVEKMQSFVLPANMTMSPPQDIDATFLPRNGQLMRIATWHEQTKQIVFDAHVPSSSLDHTEAYDVVRLHEALYYLDRWVGQNNQAHVVVDSQWTRFVTACIYSSNCSDTELESLTKRLYMLYFIGNQQMGRFVCDDL